MHPGWAQGRRQVLKELPQDLPPGLAGCIGDGEAHVLEFAVSGEPDVVIVQFINAGPHRGAADLHQVGPHLRGARVDPAKPPTVAPDLSCCVPHRQRRFDRK